MLPAVFLPDPGCYSENTRRLYWRRRVLVGCRRPLFESGRDVFAQFKVCNVRKQARFFLNGGVQQIVFVSNKICVGWIFWSSENIRQMVHVLDKVL